jgi:cobalt/nickel transport system permease protein
MQFEGFERHSAGSGVLHRLDARIKLLATLIFILIVLATPFGAWTLLGAEGLLLAFIIGAAGIPPRELARRWMAFFVLVGFLTVMIAPANPARAQHGLLVVVATILIKNALALMAMLVLAGTTPLHSLLTAVRKLGMPSVLVATLQFMDRHRHILISEVARMTTARRARTFNRRDSLAWGLLTGLIGLLFLRSFERSERLYGAMVARGWDGTIRSLDD